MRAGLVLDNCPIDQGPRTSSYQKLEALGAGAVGTLWTHGTRHGRAVYELCEELLDQPLYIVRVGGHRQTAAEWLAWARAALAEVPETVLLAKRVLLVCGNEPNLEGYKADPAAYVRLYLEVLASGVAVPVAAAGPSFGAPDGFDYWRRMLTAAGGRFARLIVNLYAHMVPLIDELAKVAGELYVGEVNRLELPRVDFLARACQRFARAGVRAALVFIADGSSGGEWDERYIVSLDECAQLGARRAEWENVTQGGSSMPLQDQYPQQFEAWRNAGGVDNNFLPYLLATGALTPTAAHVPTLIGNARAKIGELEAVLKKLLPFG